MYGTYFLLLTLIAAFVAASTALDPATMIMQGALVPYNLMHDVTLGIPVWLTPVSSLGLHANLRHLGSNLIVLVLVGPLVERLCGSMRYLMLFVLCGIVGGLTQVAVDPASHMPILGASGAISGMLGAYVVRHPLARTLFGIPVAVPILLWAAMQCIDSGLLSTTEVTEINHPTGPIAYAAHVGGFLCGTLTIGLFESL